MFHDDGDDDDDDDDDDEDEMVLPLFSRFIPGSSFLCSFRSDVLYR